MDKRLFALIACVLLAIGCSGEKAHHLGKIQTSTVTTQDELDKGNRRINEFKQELLMKGFRAVSSHSSDSIEQVILEGRYGGLKDLQVTLWTGKRLEMKDPQLGGGIDAVIVSQESEYEFHELYKRVASIVVGKS